MDNSLRSIIDQSKSILILLPSKPFFDQVAAGLSLYLSIKDQKQVQVATDSDMTVEFNRLIGVNKVSKELGNKNLVIKFTDYPANDIERVSYDIEDGQFRLSVIPKESINPPTQEQIDFNYSGISADTIILVGGANESHFPFLDKDEISNAKLVHIGTKNLTTSKQVIAFSTNASSASEIMARLLIENKFKVDQDIATNLIMGIEDGSDNFTSEDVTPITFEVFAELLRAGGKRSGKSGQQDYPQGSIPGQQPQAQSGQSQQSGQQNKDSSGSHSQGQQEGNSQKSGESNEPQTQGTGSQSGDGAPKDWLEPKIYKGTSIK